MVVELPRRAAGRSASAPSRAEGDATTTTTTTHHDRRHDDDDDADDDDATPPLAIASASHDGTRVGRNVAASTHAWAVQPSAIVLAVALDAYS